jgi:hypothetical protein
VPSQNASQGRGINIIIYKKLLLFKVLQAVCKPHDAYTDHERYQCWYLRMASPELALAFAHVLNHCTTPNRNSSMASPCHNQQEGVGTNKPVQDSHWILEGRPFREEHAFSTLVLVNPACIARFFPAANINLFLFPSFPSNPEQVNLGLTSSNVVNCFEYG